MRLPTLLLLPLLLALAGIAVAQPDDGRDVELMATFREVARLESQATRAENDGRLDEAERALWQAVELIELKGGRQHVTTFEKRSALARFYERNDRFDDAERLLKLNIEVFETTPAENQQGAGWTSELVKFYQNRKRFAEAEELLLRSDTPPGDAWQADIGSIRFALLYAKWRRFDDARKREERVAGAIRDGVARMKANKNDKAVRNRTFIALYTVVALRDLADAYDQEGRPDLAEATYKMRVELGEGGGSKSSEFERDLAAFYRDRGDLARAATALERILERNPDSARELAAIYAEQGRYPQAEQLIKRLLAFYDGKSWAEADGQQRIAALYARQGRHADAASLLERALATVGAADQRAIDRAAWQKQLGDELKILGRPTEAQARYDEAERLLKSAVEENRRYRLRAQTEAHLILAGYYAEWGRHSEALPLAREALLFGEKRYGPAHRFTATPLQLVADVLEKVGEPAQAREYARRALEIRERTRGAAHPDTLASREAVARIEAALKQ